MPFAKASLMAMHMSVGREIDFTSLLREIQSHVAEGFGCKMG